MDILLRARAVAGAHQLFFPRLRLKAYTTNIQLIHTFYKRCHQSRRTSHYFTALLLTPDLCSEFGVVPQPTDTRVRPWLHSFTPSLFSNLLCLQVDRLSDIVIDLVMWFANCYRCFVHYLTHVWVYEWVSAWVSEWVSWTSQSEKRNWRNQNSVRTRGDYLGWIYVK
jgi:hypothetical protein